MGAAMPLSVALATLAAMGIGGGAVLQQGQAHALADPGAITPRLVLTLMRRPAWLAGVLVMVLGFAAQAAALGLGRLAVVEPVLATALVFALLLSAARRRRWPGLIDWVAALCAAGGVAAFLILGHPSGGRARPPISAWAPVLAALCLVVGGAVRWGPRWPAAHRAVRLAVCAGLALGGSDALTKTTIAVAAARHLAVLTTFAPYALVVAGAAGFLLQQHAYRVGELAAALPASAVAEPVTGTLLGLTLFQERVGVHGWPVGLGIVGAVGAMLWGVRRLAAAPLVVAATGPPLRGGRGLDPEATPTAPGSAPVTQDPLGP